MPNTPKVALLIETSRSYGRSLLRGIVRYSRLHGPWSFYMTPGDFEQALPKMEQWGGTGIIARIETPSLGKAILATRLPVVALDLAEHELSESNPLSQLCEMSSDSYNASRLAAQHLLEKGFRTYAFVGKPERVWSNRRRDSFVEHIEKAGFRCFVYDPPRRIKDRDWGREQSILAEWLKGLPHPVGLMACNDERGREVLEACREAKVRVPEDIAVIGVDNDTLICELSDPPMSSIAMNADRGGFEAAALLDQMMAGKIKQAQRIVVEPLHVVTRRSTNIVALSDPEVAAAVQLIHTNASQPLRVSDVVDSLGISRRSLEIRFRRTIGRSMNEEIQLAHLERAQRLLMETDMPLPKVAEEAGFNSASYLTVVFQKRYGMPPAKYRTYVRNR